MRPIYVIFRILQRFISAGFLVTIVLDLLVAGLLLSRLVMYGPIGVTETITNNFGVIEQQDLQAPFTDFAIAMAILLSLTALLALAERTLGQVSNLEPRRPASPIGAPNVQPQ